MLYKVGFDPASHLGFKKKKSVSDTKTFLLLFLDLYFFSDGNGLLGSGRVKLHSALHQIVSLDPRVNAFLSSDLEGFLFLSI